jgi:hypothetical protein
MVLGPAASYIQRMHNLLFVALILTAASSGWPSTHPHKIKDAADAIATACENTGVHTSPKFVKFHKDCESEFRAWSEGRCWIVRQSMATPIDPRGTIIRLDALSGRTISEVMRD